MIEDGVRETSVGGVLEVDADAPAGIIEGVDVNAVKVFPATIALVEIPLFEPKEVIHFLR